MQTVGSLAGILALAFLCESLTEYLFSRWFTGARANSVYLSYIAAAVGVALALTYRVDLVGPAFGMEGRVPYLGEVLTGFILGRGANYVHDFYSRFVRKP